MPLRDHFRPPIWTRSSWEGFHGMWPAMMVQRLVPVLPEQYVAEPRVHLGSYCEIDVCAFEEDSREFEDRSAPMHGLGSVDPEGVTTAHYSPPQPTLVLGRIWRSSTPTRFWFLICRKVGNWWRPSRSSVLRTNIRR